MMMTPPSHFFPLLLFHILLFSHGIVPPVAASSNRVQEEHDASPSLQQVQASTRVQGGSLHHDEHPLINVTDWEVFPDVGLEQQFLNTSRRVLGTFEVCALCTCCAPVKRRFCIPSACCYTITCGSPNKPFGFCSFRPVACNCLSCRL